MQLLEKAMVEVMVNQIHALFKQSFYLNELQFQNVMLSMKFQNHLVIIQCVSST